MKRFVLDNIMGRLLGMVIFYLCISIIYLFYNGKLV